MKTLKHSNENTLIKNHYKPINSSERHKTDLLNIPQSAISSKILI